MSPLSEEARAYGQGAVGGYVKLKDLLPGATLRLTLVDVSQHTAAKYGVKDKTGKDLGWCYRFLTNDGKSWDVTAKALYAPLLGWGLAGGATWVKPLAVVVARKTTPIKPMECPYTVTLAPPEGAAA